MFAFLKKRIVVDLSGEEIRRVTNLLDQQAIKYELRTKRTRGSIGTALDSRSYAASNIAMYKGASTPPVVYMVYVNRSDYAKAFDLLY
ncbi:MAG: hypothetical protein RQ728_06330 [Brevefilum sp.]|nr:hypothetical protein [Brevefilum sp.]MDW7755694.1 hypothetical protein [Brevefilum sp.]